MAEKIPEFDSLPEEEIEGLSSELLQETIHAFQEKGYKIQIHITKDNVKHYAVIDKKGKVMARYSDTYNSKNSQAKRTETEDTDHIAESIELSETMYTRKSKPLDSLTEEEKKRAN